MKKTLILCSMLIAGMLNLNAQSSSSEEVAIKKGENSVYVYYGTNLLGSVYKAGLKGSTLNVSTKTMGPIGLVYEHMVTDIIGLGAEFGYSKFTLNYDETYYGYNGREVYTSTVDITTIRAMFRANFHFAPAEKFDAYGLISAGYRTTNWSVSTNNPNGSSTFSFGGFLPFGVKPGIGLRYLFTKNLGVNIELAAGTPLMCGGLVFKF